MNKTIEDLVISLKEFDRAWKAWINYQLDNERRDRVLAAKAQFETNNVAVLPTASQRKIGEFYCMCSGDGKAAPKGAKLCRQCVTPV